MRKQSNVSQKSNSKKAPAKKQAKADSDEDEDMDGEEEKGGESGPSELFVGNMSFNMDENAISQQFA